MKFAIGKAHAKKKYRSFGALFQLTEKAYLPVKKKKGGLAKKKKVKLFKDEDDEESF